MALRLDDATLLRYRKMLLRKGRQIAEELADLLAGKGKSVEPGRLPLVAQKPGMKPEERLRAYLDHVEACRKLLDAGDDRFGRCRLCNVDLGPVALDQMPWADRCEACAARIG